MTSTHPSSALVPDIASIQPTRRLPAKERAVFRKVLADFIHLQPSDAEQLTQYAEAVVRYQKAEKETRKRPTISTPVINRSTGNVTGEKIIRNPAWATLKEAQQQMNTLARRLMIDATSADKRQRLLTKKARSLAAQETGSAESQSAIANLTEFQIQERIAELRKVYTQATDDVIRDAAIWELTVCDPLLNDTEGDEDLYGCPESNFQIDQ
jgi:phage terminase small subunit